MIQLKEVVHGPSPSASMNALCQKGLFGSKPQIQRGNVLSSHKERWNSKSTWLTCPVKCPGVHDPLQWPVFPAVGCFMQVLEVWDSQHHRPCASKHLHHLKRLIQSVMSPTVNHRNFMRKKADGAANCHDWQIFRMLQHSNNSWSRIIWFCCFDTVSLEATINIWMVSLWYEIYLPPPLFANSRNLGFFLFPLGKRWLKHF